jgi:hypothetical protein
MQQTAARFFEELIYQTSGSTTGKLGSAITGASAIPVYSHGPTSKIQSGMGFF